jgi:hypothetical protein
VVQLLQIGKLINLAGQGGFSGGGPSDPGEVGVNAVDFDGTNDYLLRGADYDGSLDSIKGTIVLWTKMNGGDGATLLFMGTSAATQSVNLARVADNTWRFILKDSAIDILVFVNSDFTTVIADGWKCLMISWNLVATPVVLMYLGDTAATLTVTTKLAGIVDNTVPDHSVGALVNGNNKINACLAQLYHNDHEFIDFSVESNRRKFFSSGGSPVDLQADGSGPTGTAPILFLSGATASWHTNKGTGGGMTETGALTDCATSPSAFPVIFTAAFVAAFT